jgi:glycosyltransferase involved in cell wall biosynthesis
MEPLAQAPMTAQQLPRPLPQNLSGRRIVLIHPAWHSCGSHQVFVSQAQAYRALGATVFSLAIADFPGWTAGSLAHRAYLEATPDLIAERRYFAGMPAHHMARPAFLHALWQWLHGDAASMLLATAGSAQLSDEILGLADIDLIHCNHFFCVPVARRLKGKRSCPILLDTHDVQARQFALRNEGRFLLPPKARYEDMLALECDEMRNADLLIHLNHEEAQSWRALLPDQAHALIYPALKPMPTGPGGADVIIVASANYPNYLSLKWFLEKVRPRAAEVPLRIIGNIDQIFKARAPELFAEHSGLFCGRIDDLAGAYASAGLILLPTISGHGLSIKAVEALSSGAPLIATKEAFRGIDIDPATLANVTLVADAEAFAEALRRLAAKPSASSQDRQASDTRRLYEQLFSFDAYQHALGAAVTPLL